MSAFRDWAEQQFGRRPDYCGLSDDALRLRISGLEFFKGELAQREAYDAAMNAALYGWNAGPGFESKR